MHFLVSPHIKVHGTKYTRDRAHARTHTRVSVAQEVCLRRTVVSAS